jgi:hypothetical protein
MSKFVSEVLPPDEPVFAQSHFNGSDEKEGKSFFLYDTFNAVLDNTRYYDSKMLGELYTLAEIALPEGRQLDSLKTQIKLAVFRWQELYFKTIGENFDHLRTVMGLDYGDGQICVNAPAIVDESRKFAIRTDCSGCSNQKEFPVEAVCCYDCHEEVLLCPDCITRRKCPSCYAKLNS